MRTPELLFRQEAKLRGGVQPEERGGAMRGEGESSRLHQFTISAFSEEIVSRRLCRRLASISNYFLGEKETEGAAVFHFVFAYSSHYS